MRGTYPDYIYRQVMYEGGHTQITFTARLCMRGTYPDYIYHQVMYEGDIPRLHLPPGYV